MTYLWKLKKCYEAIQQTHRRSSSIWKWFIGSDPKFYNNILIVSNNSGKKNKFDQLPKKIFLKENVAKKGFKIIIEIKKYNNKKGCSYGQYWSLFRILQYQMQKWKFFLLAKEQKWENALKLRMLFGFD